MSNYNPYSSFISGLNMNMTPEDSQEDLDANLEFWSNAHFTFDVPAGIGLLDDDFDVSLNKLESTDTEITEITQSSTLVQPEISSFAPSTAQTIYHPLLSYQNPSAPTRLQPVVPIAPAVTNTSNNYSPIFPAPSTTSNGVTAIKKNNPVIAQKEESSPLPAATTANSKITTVTNNPSRKNSVKSAQSLPPTDTDSLSDATNKNTESSTVDPEIAAKIAAEEDKRRRNTAASARFRVKKKLREQALERTAKEMSQKAETLEARVKELEMEIRWLRSLIVEKDSRLLDVKPHEKKRKASVKSETLSEESAEDEEKEKNAKKVKNDQKPIIINE